jgi:hypothetical protein
MKTKPKFFQIFFSRLQAEPGLPSLGFGLKSGLLSEATDFTEHLGNTLTGRRPRRRFLLI